MKDILDSRQLRAFVVLARTGSFTRTGQELGLSQSAISHSMRSLEEESGCRLLDRIGKMAVLTQAGEHLLPHAEKVLQEMAAALSELHRLGKWGSSRLRVGASATACCYLLPAVLREFKESFPRCNLSISPSDAPQAMKALREHEIDLAVTLEPMRAESLDFRLLFTDELMFVVDPLHPWAKSGKVDRSEIARQNYILYEKSSYTVQLVSEYFRTEEIVLNSMIDLGSMDAIKELVKLGLGVSIIAPWTARKELEEGSLIGLPLGRRKLRRRWGTLSWHGRRLGLAEETFIGLCQSVAQDLLEWV